MYAQLDFISFCPVVKTYKSLDDVRSTRVNVAPKGGCHVWHNNLWVALQSVILSLTSCLTWAKKSSTSVSHVCRICLLGKGAALG